jgi:hypothetical protein
VLRNNVKNPKNPEITIIITHVLKLGLGIIIIIGGISANKDITNSNYVGIYFHRNKGGISPPPINPYAIVAPALPVIIQPILLLI